MHAASAARRQGPSLLLNQTDDLGANSAEPRDAHFQGCDHDEKNLPEKLKLGMTWSENRTSIFRESHLSPIGERNHVVQRFNAAFKEAPYAARGLADTLLVFDHRDADIALAMLAKGDAGRDHHAGFLHHQG